MIIKVFNREKCIDYALSNVDKRLFIISISDCDKNPPIQLRCSSVRHRVAFLQFDDDEIGPNIMRAADALQLAQEIISMKNEVDEIIVHCEAGISRSSAIAAAISLFLNNDDSEFFKFPFCPNELCYKLMLQSFGFCLDNIPIEQKFKDNITDLCKHIGEF